MELLDNYSLSLIFQQLTLKDLAICSKVCQKWKKIIKSFKQKHLFFCYGTKYFKEKINCYHDLLVLDQKSFLVPCYLNYDTIFTYEKIFNFNDIETSIFHGSKSYGISALFYNKPNLKYVEIKDFSFCTRIQKNFSKYLDDKKLNRDAFCKYFSKSIETLIIDKIEFFMLIVGFPNLKNVIIRELSHNYTKEVPEECEMVNLKTFSLKNDKYNFIDEKLDYVLDFLNNKCPSLESVSININSESNLDKLLSNLKLKHICVKLCYEQSGRVPVDNYINVILKHKTRWEEDCNMCINHLQIENEKDFLKSVKNSKLFEIVNQNDFIFNEKSKTLKINCSTDTEIIKNYKNINYTRKVYIYLSQEVEINLLFSSLPKTIKSLSISFKVNENILNLIGKNFLYLEKLTLSKRRQKIDSFGFISELNYLNTLTLHEMSVDFEMLLSSIKKANFLKFIIITTNDTLNLETTSLLKNFFENQKQFSYLKLNKKMFLSRNFSKIDI